MSARARPLAYFYTIIIIISFIHRDNPERFVPIAKRTWTEDHTEFGFLYNIADNDLSTSFFDVQAACLIFLTIPVTVASAERSFYELKNNRKLFSEFHSKDVQERLRHFHILNIERRRTSDIDVEKIIDNFGKMQKNQIQIVFRLFKILH